MGVDRLGDVVDGGPRPHRDDGLVEQDRGLVPDGVCPEYLAVRGREHLHEPVVELLRSSHRRVGVVRPPDGVLGSVLPERVFSPTDAGDLRLGEDRVGHRGQIDRPTVVVDDVRDRVTGLVIPRVFEQGVPRDVALRPDVLGGGPQVLVGLDEPAVVDRDARGVEIEGVAVGPAPQRDQDLVALDGHRVAGLGFGVDGVAVRRFLDRGDAVTGVDLVAVGRDPGERRRDLVVLAGDQVVHHLDDRHVRPHGVEEVPQFDGDVAATHDHHAVGRLPEVERVPAGEVVDPVEPVDRRDDRPAPGGDDDLLGGDGLAGELDRSLVDEPRAFVEQREVVHLAVARRHVGRDTAQEVVHLVDDGRVVDPVQRGVDVEPIGLLDVTDRVGGLDEHLRGVTAAVETGPAERPRLDERRLQSGVGRRGGDVVARSAADDEDVEVSHG